MATRSRPGTDTFEGGKLYGGDRKMGREIQPPETRPGWDLPSAGKSYIAKWPGKGNFYVELHLDELVNSQKTTFTNVLSFMA